MIMCAIIFILSEFIGYFGTGYGIYKYFIKKDKIQGNRIWAYTFFAFALGSSIISNYVIMLLEEGLAIYYFVKYVKMREVN